jgi:hypothetical protein
MANAKSQVSDQERLLVRPRRACYLLDCGITRLYELLDQGELESFLDGRSRKITVESIRCYVAKRLAGADKKNPVPQGSAKSASVGASAVPREPGRRKPLPEPSGRKPSGGIPPREAGKTGDDSVPR